MNWNCAISSITRTLVRREVIVIAVCWLAIDFLMLPDTTAVKRAVERLTPAPRRTGHSNYEIDVELDAWLDGQQLRFGERRDLPDATQGFLMAVGATRKLGLWAPTVERRTIFVHVEPRGMIPMTRAHAVIADHLDTQDDPDGAFYAGLLRSGVTAQDRTLPWGFARNAIALAAAALLCCATIGRSRAAIASSRQQRRQQRGQCVQCGYALQPSGATGCPEFGWRRSTDAH